MEEEPKLLIPDEILVDPENVSSQEDHHAGPKDPLFSRDPFTLIKDTRIFNFIAAIGYFVLLLVCLIPGVFVLVLSVVGRLVGDANPPVMGRFFKVIVLLFLRMLGCLLGAFYPPLGRAFLRLFEY